MTDRLGAADLPLSVIETLVETEVVDFLNSEFEFGHDRLILEVIYINGSFGAEAATPESDIDLTVGFLANEAVEAIHPDEWIRVSQRLSNQLDSVAGHSLDIQVFPTSRAIDHVERRCRHADYDTAYNLGSRTYVPVTDLW